MRMKSTDSNKAAALALFFDHDDSDDGNGATDDDYETLAMTVVTGRWRRGVEGLGGGGGGECG